MSVEARTRQAVFLSFLVTGLSVGFIEWWGLTLFPAPSVMGAVSCLFAWIVGASAAGWLANHARGEMSSEAQGIANTNFAGLALIVGGLLIPFASINVMVVHLAWWPLCIVLAVVLPLAALFGSGLAPITRRWLR